MMIELNIPGYGHLKLSHLVLDFNGTLAFDGRLHEGVHLQLADLAKHLNIRVVTADTFGTANEELHGVPCHVEVLQPERQAEAKRDIVQRLGADSTVAIGNGRNDAQMMQLAVLAIATIGAEGAAGEALTVADVVVNDIRDALGLLQHQQRLVATLRS
jgi:soluble P-type ATPase